MATDLSRREASSALGDKCARTTDTSTFRLTRVTGGNLNRRLRDCSERGRKPHQNSAAQYKAGVAAIIQTRLNSLVLAQEQCNTQRSPQGVSSIRFPAGSWGDWPQVRQRIDSDHVRWPSSNSLSPSWLPNACHCEVRRHVTAITVQFGRSNKLSSGCICCSLNGMQTSHNDSKALDSYAFVNILLASRCCRPRCLDAAAPAYHVHSHATHLSE